MKHIAILGSTGSIGTQTLDIVDQNEDLKVVALPAWPLPTDHPYRHIP